MSYSIEEHKHRFATWAAGRAANVRGCRFKVQQAKSILESAGLRTVSLSVQNLPPPEYFDIEHRKWRSEVIEAAEGHKLLFTHGVAAKLINVYLKSIFVCGNSHEDQRVKAIHPPIDSLLLDDLYRLNIGNKKSEWSKARKARWSKLDSDSYENLIKAIKSSVPAGAGLWEIEESWVGHQ